MEYVKGESNEVPDCMSRYSYPAGLLDVSMHGNIEDDHDMQEIIMKELAEERQCVCVSMGSLPKHHSRNNGMNAKLQVDLNVPATVPEMVKCVAVSIFSSRRGRTDHKVSSCSKVKADPKVGGSKSNMAPNESDQGSSAVLWLHCLTNKEIQVCTRGGAITKPVFKSKAKLPV